MLLYYYINLRLSIINDFFYFGSSIVLCLSSEGMNLSLSISFSFASESFCGEVLETCNFTSNFISS